MLRTILIDDEALALQSLQRDLQTYCDQDVKVIATCDSPLSGLQAIRRLRPDLVFLDIGMEGYQIDGFGMLEILEEISFSLVFVTAYPDYALRAFEVSAVDYLVKPFTPESLLKAVHKATCQRHPPTSQELRELIDQLQHPVPCEPPQLSFPVADGVVYLRPDQIMFCRAEGAYTRLTLEQEAPLLISSGLRAVEKRLPPHLFFRIHYSYAINRQFLKKYFTKGKEADVVLLADGTKLPVSRNRKQDFLAWMKEKDLTP